MPALPLAAVAEPALNPEPADPQQRGADNTEHKIVRGHRLARVAATPAHDQRCHQAGKPGIDVHDGPTSKIENPRVVEEAVGPPDKMGDRRINAHAPQPDEPQQCRKLHPIGKGPTDQRWSDDRERHLKGHIDRFGDRLGQIVDRVEAHPKQQEPARTPEKRRSFGKSEAVADHHPQHRDETGHGEALHYRRQDVHLADHAAVKQGQTRDGHHQDERNRGQHPRRVAGIQPGCRLRPRVWGLLRERRRGPRHRQRPSPNYSLQSYTHQSPSNTPRLRPVIRVRSEPCAAPKNRASQ
jgi:hypothetical protein